MTGHDVPAREDEAVPPPEAGEDSAEQNLDRPATPQEGPVNGCEPELRPYKAGGTNQREPPVVPPCGDEEE